MSSCPAVFKSDIEIIKLFLINIINSANKSIDYHALNAEINPEPNARAVAVWISFPGVPEAQLLNFATL